MRNTYLYFPLFLYAITLASTSCTLDKEEPAIPTGYTNEEAPVFLSADLVAITHDSIRAKARLLDYGNLEILRHGWVWSENPNPTIQDDTIGLGELYYHYGYRDSFETLLPGFTIGKTYHLRPYVATGSGETYGPEKTILMGIPKMGDIALLAGGGCFLRVQCSLQSPVPPTEYGIVYLKGAGTPTLQKKDGQATGTGLNNGSFQAELTMLSPNTTYSIRAYAVTSAGTGYSKVKFLTTPLSSLVSAGFGINTDAEIFQGAVVQFTNTSVGAATYSWNFGDGETSTEVSPVHTFNKLSNMTVRLTAENDGCMLTKDTVLKIIPNPFEDYWVAIPGGTFTMGCTAEQEPDCADNEKPVHQVTLSPFIIGRTEVTQRQWEAVMGMGNNPSNFYQFGLSLPVESVSWGRIVDVFIPAFNRKTGRTHRLPTEAEWEYAARGGADTSSMKKYAGSDDLNVVGWYAGNAGQNGNVPRPHSVAGKDPNGYGLYDMSGNVWEWCYDGIYSYPSSPSTNPMGSFHGFYSTLRGGGFFTNDIHCRVAYRSSGDIYFGSSERGFRLVRE